MSIIDSLKDFADEAKEPRFSFANLSALLAIVVGIIAFLYSEGVFLPDNQLTLDLGKAESKISEIEARRNVLIEENSALKSSNENIKATLTKHEVTIEALKKERIYLKEQAERLRSEKSDFLARIEKLQKDVAEYEAGLMKEKLQLEAQQKQATTQNEKIKLEIEREKLSIQKQEVIARQKEAEAAKLRESKRAEIEKAREKRILEAEKYKADQDAKAKIRAAEAAAGIITFTPDR